jgi:hypothetical protein
MTRIPSTISIFSTWISSFFIITFSKVKCIYTNLTTDLALTHNTVSCGNLLVTIFAAPYLDSLLNAYKSQTSNTLHHCTAIPKPAAHDFANIAPYRLATGTRSLLATVTINRMAAPVTQTAETAVPLCVI